MGAMLDGRWTQCCCASCARARAGRRCSGGLGSISSSVVRRPSRRRHGGRAGQSDGSSSSSSSSRGAQQAGGSLVHSLGDGSGSTAAWRLLLLLLLLERVCDSEPRGAEGCGVRSPDIGSREGAARARAAAGRASNGGWRWRCGYGDGKGAAAVRQRAVSLLQPDAGEETGLARHDDETDWDRSPCATHYDRTRTAAMISTVHHRRIARIPHHPIAPLRNNAAALPLPPRPRQNRWRDAHGSITPDSSPPPDARLLSPALRFSLVALGERCSMPLLSPTIGDLADTGVRPCKPCAHPISAPTLLANRQPCSLPSIDMASPNRCLQPHATGSWHSPVHLLRLYTTTSYKHHPPEISPQSKHQRFFFLFIVVFGRCCSNPLSFSSSSSLARPTLSLIFACLSSPSSSTVACSVLFCLMRLAVSEPGAINPLLSGFSR